MKEKAIMKVARDWQVTFLANVSLSNSLSYEPIRYLIRLHLHLQLSRNAGSGVISCRQLKKV